MALLILLVHVCLLMSSSFARSLVQSKVRITARADDAAPLQDVVEQQARTIQALQAKLAGMEARLQSAESRLQKQVAFTVHFSQHSVSVGLHSTLVFDTVVTNIGNAYDSRSGLFTSPYDGVYVFFLTAMSENSHGVIQLALRKGDTELAVTWGDGQNDPNDQETAHVLVPLKAGDRVWVSHKDGDTELYGGPWSTFSGWLVHADL
ncbi:complement C1q tumor necrosis factor-related protein 4-like [Pomacea canaliculata]|uniref:complement C1q tumor necrosis factor-related protein 4-like n=1 Tax=Pomacea canaliculata TaxID=400727 RepID=UPI000D7379FE|nr:complement C1q tumor necrosis factor-related protein 4-like [Pomacea canaliculata]